MREKIVPLHPSEHQLTVEWRNEGGWRVKKRLDFGKAHCFPFFVSQ